MMSASPTLSHLFADLDEMHRALQADDLERLQAVMTRHDLGVRLYMQSHAQQADRQALAQLFTGQRDLQAAMEQAREHASQQMQATQRAGRATRAYLSLVGA